MRVVYFLYICDLRTLLEPHLHISLFTVVVDLTKPVPGTVIDGKLDNFQDLEFTSSRAKVEAQWKDYYDPESLIKQYEVQVSSAK